MTREKTLVSDIGDVRDEEWRFVHGGVSYHNSGSGLRRSPVNH
jgi:hypothetical protein